MFIHVMMFKNIMCYFIFPAAHIIYYLSCDISMSKKPCWCQTWSSCQDLTENPTWWPHSSEGIRQSPSHNTMGQLQSVNRMTVKMKRLHSHNGCGQQKTFQKGPVIVAVDDIIVVLGFFVVVCCQQQMMQHWSSDNMNSISMCQCPLVINVVVLQYRW